MKEQESKLQQAYTRMENGEAPDDQIQAEWERKLQDENRRKLAQLEKMKVHRVSGNDIIMGMLNWSSDSLIHNEMA